jgi:hypothetical protein
MKFINNTKMTFHSGNAFEAAGIDPEPFATFTHAGIVDRVLIDKIARVVRDHVNRHDKDFCNIKISTEDWDC